MSAPRACPLETVATACYPLLMLNGAVRTSASLRKCRNDSMEQCDQLTDVNILTRGFQEAAVALNRCFGLSVYGYPAWC